MSSTEDFVRRLKTVPTTRVEGIVVRVVADAALHHTKQPDFLYTSGKPNRYNMAGVECVYFSADESTARAELSRALTIPGNTFQPLTTFWAKVSLGTVLDLTNPKIRAYVGLTRNDLNQDWRGAAKPVKTQLLGDAITGEGTISAIRYPSNAQPESFNVVIFRKALIAPDTLKILGPNNRILQEWP